MAGTHIHLYFCAWSNESRAWRAGSAALEAGYGDKIWYVGYKISGSPEYEDHGPDQNIIRIGPEPSKPGTPRLLRALSLPRWWLSCVRRFKKDSSITQITAHSLAALPAGVLLSKRLGVPLVYDAHELESEREGWSPKVRKIARMIEARLIGYVDHLLVVNDSIGEWYSEAYGLRPITVLRNVPEIAPEKSEGHSTWLREALSIPHDALIYIYCGSMGQGRGLSQKIDAFRQLGMEHHLVLLGYGAAVETLRAQTQGAENIHFHPAVPQADLIEALASADVGLWVPDGTSLSYHYALPNKLFEYSAAGLALMLGEGPELTRYGAAYPATRFTTADPAQISDAVRAWSLSEIQNARAQVEDFVPPHWGSEKNRLFDAYDSIGLRQDPS